MNKTIENLIEQSGLYIAYENKQVTEKELEFFAELIIFECIKLAVFKGDAKTGQAIKEHFDCKLVDLNSGVRYTGLIG